MLMGGQRQFAVKEGELSCIWTELHTRFTGRPTFGPWIFVLIFVRWHPPNTHSGRLFNNYWFSMCSSLDPISIGFEGRKPDEMFRHQIAMQSTPHFCNSDVCRIS
ncbi:hypothetical protein CEXT_726231 [Caerostris extrusa]|uniref:Uncharacterized protein n=1 Tax=Caerostris extrusa TaxID=172846 RepID=A0AAV4XCP6_CAEEX|nr:hypothetical protein CEXT_726231 [Caerostris extrusa]